MLFVAYLIITYILLQQYSLSLTLLYTIFNNLILHKQFN